MPPVQPSASVAATGLGIRYIGDEHCYAYSGGVTDAGTGGANAILLNFNSGSGLINGKLQFETNSIFSQTYFLDVIFNDQSIYDVSWDASPGKIFHSPLYLIIPPFTSVVVKWGMTNDTRIGFAVFTGRVYGAE